MDKKLSAHMAKALIKRAGGIPAACAAIEAETGEGIAAGTLSKVQNGHLDISFLCVLALTKATGDRSFVNLLNRECEDATGAEEILAHHLEMLRESTEMVEAVARAEQKPSRETIQRARKEAADVHEQSGRAIAAYDAMLNELNAGVASIRRSIAGDVQ
ncbi:hypothetical protein TM1040_1635 [Ruegeria sp. TM1040]|uniref:hypothetical protein n=1 Tax=Ruegeria sp. (strain TM1040) TaxID=292414 RepID=UPI00005550CA|nr:hypothetical protein [Ruegeria sp. TM1040]ABF64368.1 hypothetical protein TM1040_1635 [Ruegeria sp. TM1040]